LLGNRIISHPQSALDSMIRGIEEKPRLGKDLTSLSVEPLVVIFEKQPYDKVIRYWPAVKGVCYQTEKLDPLLGGILFYQNGTLRSDARQLINEILDFQFNSEKGVLPMDESIFELFDESVAYRVLGHAMGMNFQMFVYNGTILDRGTNLQPIKPPSITLARYNVKNVWPTIPKVWLEYPEPLHITGWENFNLRKYYSFLDVFFPNSWEYTKILYDTLNSREYGKKMLNFMWNLYRISFEHNLSEDKDPLNREDLVDSCPLYGSALRIPVYPIVSYNPNFEPHGEIGFSLTKQERSILQSKITSIGETLLIDEEVQGICLLYPTKERFRLDCMPGSGRVENWEYGVYGYYSTGVNSPRLIYQT
jgi:hypothetical protein